MSRTFLQARGEISQLLHERGWTLSSPLKIPYATSPSGRLRLWFKAQAVYFTEGSHHEFKNARTLSYDLDIRKISAEQFLTALQRWFPETARDLSHALPGGLEFTDAERKHMARMERRARKLRALRRSSGAGHHQHPKFSRDPKKLAIWRQNPATGLWEHQRNVKPEEAEQWLAIFRRDEPNAKFVVSRNKPAFRSEHFAKLRRRRDPNNPDDQLDLPFGGTVTDVLGRTRTIKKVWPGGEYECPFCHYPVSKPSERPCANPWCFAHPNYPVARAREELAKAEAKKREDAQREETKASVARYHEERRIEEQKRANALIEEAKRKGACLRCLDTRAGYKPKMVKHRGACPKERGRDPRRGRRDLIIPRGGATHGRDLKQYTTEVKALLFAKGYGTYYVDETVKNGKAWVFDAWRKGAPPCAVADQFASRMRRDPGRKKRVPKLTAAGRAHAKKLEVLLLIHGQKYLGLSEEELQLVRDYKAEREARKKRKKRRA